MKKNPEQNNDVDVVFNFQKNTFRIISSSDITLKIPAVIKPLITTEVKLAIRAYLEGNFNEARKKLTALKDNNKALISALLGALSCVEGNFSLDTVEQQFTADGMTSEILSFALGLPVLPGSTAKNSNLSALYQLSSSPSNMNLITKLINKYSLIFSAEALCRMRSAIAGEHANTAPLFWFFCHDTTTEYILELCKSSTQFCKDIPAQVVCALRSDQTWKDISTFVLLGSNSKGHAILELLINHNPSFAKNVTIESLWTKVECEQQIFHNSTALFHLCTTNPPDLNISTANPISFGMINFPMFEFESLRILQLLFDKNPQLMANLPSEAVCDMRPALLDDDGNNSVLSIWANTERGRNFLLTCIKNNPDFLKTFKIKPLFTNFTSNGKLRDCVMCNLAITKDGRQFIMDLFSLGKHLSDQIIPDYILTPALDMDVEKTLSTAAAFFKSSHLTAEEIEARRNMLRYQGTICHSLSLYPKGKTILNLWKENNPKLHTAIDNPLKFMNPKSTTTSSTTNIKESLILLKQATQKESWKHSGKKKCFWLRGKKNDLEDVVSFLKEKNVTLTFSQVQKKSDWCIVIKESKSLEQNLTKSLKLG